MKKALFATIAGLVALLAYREHVHAVQIKNLRADVTQTVSDELLAACEARIDEILGQF